MLDKCCYDFPSDCDGCPFNKLYNGYVCNLMDEFSERNEPFKVGLRRTIEALQDLYKELSTGEKKMTTKEIKMDAEVTK